MVSSEDATPMDALVPDVSPALVRIVTRCLQKQPALRFADVAELDAALAPFAPAKRDTMPWEPVVEPLAVPVREPNEPSTPTSSWNSPPRAQPAATPGGSSRWWMVALALFAGAGAFAWLRNVAIEKLEHAPDDVEVREGDDIDDPRAPAGAASTGADDDGLDTKIDEPSVPPRVVLVPAVTPTEPEPAATTTGAEDTDGIAVVPSVPPEPDTDGIADTSPSGTLPPPPSDPDGVFRVGRYVALDKSLSASPHRTAKNYCDRLRATSYLGIRGWALPNPAQSAKLVGHPSVRKGRYWTSALHRGRALVIALPSGTKSSISSERGRARGLCIARWP
jgi:serine/threonine-protein kinase